MSPGQTIIGGVVSSTVTFWLHSVWLPQASVARHARVASKVLQQWPVVLVIVLTMAMFTLPQVSLAVGPSKPHGLAHSTVLSPTHVIIGGAVSTVAMV